ncbi:MAG: MBL fold metallo-hydrolase [Acidimicrobiia bacterium]|nr:MBL fold metallo-hydrolase [Acidimicrobiia bacterium]
MQVGEFSVTPVLDGRFELPATLFFPSTSEEDWAPHHRFLNEDGTLPLDVGGFLVRYGRRTILIDVGVGPPAPAPGFGVFLDGLAAQGVSPAEVTDVVFTHLHFDHIGWASAEGAPVFPNATYRCHQLDWDFFLSPDLPEIQTGKILGAQLTPPERLTPIAGHIEAWDGDGPIVPGIDVRHAPGHTPGNTVIVLSSGTDRAILLGDVCHCPVELLDSGFEAVGDVDPDLARRTRQAWIDELEGTRVPATAAHFPGMQFGRLLPAQGKRQWVIG